jgi:hypothetical protein
MGHIALILISAIITISGTIVLAALGLTFAGGVILQAITGE